MIFHGTGMNMLKKIKYAGFNCFLIISGGFI